LLNSLSKSHPLPVKKTQSSKAVYRPEENEAVAQMAIYLTSLFNRLAAPNLCDFSIKYKKLNSNDEKKLVGIVKSIATINCDVNHNLFKLTPFSNDNLAQRLQFTCVLVKD